MCSQAGLHIRLLHDGDSIAELTELLHRAYRSLSERGMNYLAATQDEAKTRDRIQCGECYVAVLEGRVVGTIKLDWPRRHQGTPQYRKERVASFHQFAVEPELQGRGIGSALLDVVERRARDAGMTELSLDTAETASELVGFYERRGYRFVEYVQWPKAKYRSVVMTKLLG